MELIIASGNVHKIREYRELFKNLKGFEILSLRNFPEYASVEETGSSFTENAKIKARHASSILKKWVLADDSGLVVPRLKNEPGIYSRRYAGPEASDAENRKKLLHEMRNFQGPDRDAYFECALALCGPSDGYEKCVIGTCEGSILTEERGRNGFGYDSLFIKHDYDKTFAELDESVKNRISHRYKAFEKLINTLASL